jgi:hypothetical protein
LIGLLNSLAMRKRVKMTGPESRPGKRLSRSAIAGLLMLPFGFLLVLLFLPSSLPSLLRGLLIGFGGIALIGSTILGFAGIRQIRSSESTWYGLRLAVFLGLFYPMILLDLFLITIGWVILGRNSSSSFLPLLWLFIVMLVDYLLIRQIWRWVNRDES